ncbi:hypothetical protein Taro_035733 [Colocasia esculenta]|uniref:Gag-pol polyprotein n=1 Tax=Colocasia esculenta TaxID=4460 RepID=A0A843W170_COLES|nr:hypothetical protein [Colocasia esculenta]
MESKDKWQLKGMQKASQSTDHLCSMGYMAEGHSVTRPPFIDGTDYPYWKNRMQHKTTSCGRSSVKEHTPFLRTKDQIAKGTLNWSALNMMQCTVHPKEYSRVSTCTSAKEKWDKLELIYEGTSVVRESKASMLISKYEMFKMRNEETISVTPQNFYL